MDVKLRRRQRDLVDNLKIVVSRSTFTVVFQSIDLIDIL
jgi:hypothetical protein